jgi:hypothetical protein
MIGRRGPAGEDDDVQVVTDDLTFTSTVTWRSISGYIRPGNSVSAMAWRLARG